jgi:hypothetical protein
MSSEPVLRLELPIRTVSEANLREAWYVRMRRKQAQQRVVALHLGPLGRPEPPLVITLTRVATRQLDTDNLAGAHKHVRDAVALWLGLDDGDPRLTWRYAQERVNGRAWFSVFTRAGKMARAHIVRTRLEIAYRTVCTQ